MIVGLALKASVVLTLFGFGLRAARRYFALAAKAGAAYTVVRSDVRRHATIRHLDAVPRSQGEVLQPAKR
jgi:hypothetical protein